LDISNNQLRTLEKGMFEPLAKLEVLVLDSNQLEDINGEIRRTALIGLVTVLFSRRSFILAGVETAQHF
jgi:Leucine-rich repeat (LRR) protein